MELTSKERNLLLWACFLALTAAGVAFAFRALGGAMLWGNEYNVLEADVGRLLGAGLWPIAVMMILFSFIVDKVGYRNSMFLAFALQVLSVIFTFTAGSFNGMLVACILAGLGHGIIEATTNPLIASTFRNEKTKFLAIFHAAWPCGLAVGTVIYMIIFKNVDTWAAAKIAWIFVILPVVIYGILFYMCKKFPVDERIEANVPYSEMLRELGGLGAFLTITFVGYELYGQLGWFQGGQYTQLLAALIIGIIGGIIFGVAVKSKGRWMFFFLCCLMVPLATAELATDAWIRKLMEPSMGNNAGWALAFSAAIMTILRFFAGVPLKYTGPLGLLLISSAFSIVGLFWLSVAYGALVVIAFIFYAIGQTFYWPAILGFTSERYPKGGALTLNTVSAMGLLTVGIFGGPFLGAVQDNYNAKAFMEVEPELIQSVKNEGRTTNIKGEDIKIVDTKVLFGVAYPTVQTKALLEQPEFSEASKAAVKKNLNVTGRKTLRVAAVLPISMLIGFFLIIMWFRSRGGYKPIILGQNQE